MDPSGLWGCGIHYNREKYKIELPKASKVFFIEGFNGLFEDVDEFYKKTILL